MTTSNQPRSNTDSKPFNDKMTHLRQTFNQKQNARKHISSFLSDVKRTATTKQK